MKTSIEVVTECLKREADEYKRKYDEIKNARERELKEANDTYKPGCKALLDNLQGKKKIAATIRTSDGLLLQRKL